MIKVDMLVDLLMAVFYTGVAVSVMLSVGIVGVIKLLKEKRGGRR